MKRKILYVSVVGFLSFLAINVMAQITSFPYTQNFDSWTLSGSTGCGGVVTLEEGWTNLSVDDFDWDIHNNQTPSGSTGPVYDHTTGYEGDGRYLYTEAGAPPTFSCTNSTAEITSPVFDLSAAGAPLVPEIRFWYNMVGAEMGVMEVLLSLDGGASWGPSVWSRAGNQGDGWKEGVINISTHFGESNFQVKFIGTTVTGINSDMAIDDFSIDEPGPLQYCESVYTNPGLTFIYNVLFNTINYTSSSEGYGDFTNESTDVLLSSEYTLTVTAAILEPVAVMQTWAWIDWNQDGDFDDVGEAYDLGEIMPPPALSTATLDITVPADAELGSTRMRVIIEKHASLDPDPCGGGTYGETEDYTVNIVDPAVIVNWSGDVSSDWQIPANWESGSVPDNTVDIIVGSGATYYPILGTGNNLEVGAGSPYACKSLLIKNGGQVILESSNYVSIYSAGSITVETGGTLEYGKRIILQGGLYITGGTVTTNFNSYGGGDLVFNNGGTGYMNSGTLTFNRSFSVAADCDWFATGGTVHGGGTGDDISIKNLSTNFYLNDLVIDENIKAGISNLSTIPLSINGDFTMEPGSEFTINQASPPYVANVQVGGLFTMKTDATASSSSLVNDGTLGISGNIDVQKYIVADRYHYFSSPVSSETANMFLNMYLYSFDESTYDPGPPAAGGWENIIEETTPLEVGVGYKVWSSSTFPNPTPPGSTIVSFESGTLNNGNYSLPVDATDQNGGGIGDGEGWNLVGNPYPSAIDWTDASWTKTNLTGSVYVYDGIQYLAWPAEGGYGTLPGGIIPSMQSFFVKATAASPALSVTNDARVHGVDAYKATTVLEDVLQLTVIGNEYQDMTFVSFNEIATEGFDDQFDAYKLIGVDEAPQLYSIGDVIYSINAQPELTNEVSIPLGFDVGAEGIYKIIPAELESFNPEVEVYLEDLQENILVNLKEVQKYLFFASPDDNAERFLLHFYPPVVGFDNDHLSTNDNGFVIYSNKQSVFVRNIEEVPCNIIVYDVMGHEIVSKANSVESDVELQLNEGTGFYIVKVMTDLGITSKKVFIK